MRRLAILAGAMVVLALGASPARAVTVEVGQGGDTFTQANVTINPGDSVHWNWDSGYHSVTSGNPPGTPNHQFDSGVQLNLGATFDQTFNHPGVYHYYCSIHYALGMTGTITVTGADPPPTAAFTIAPLSAKAGQPVSFDASTSSTPDGDTIESYSWDFGDGTPVQTTTSPTTTHTFKRAATPNVTLTITYSGSATSAPVSHALTVTAPPPPQASRLHLSKSSFCVKKSARCRRPGTEVEFALSRAAEVALVIRRNGHVLQRLSRPGRAGRNAIPFRGSGLRPGRYTLVLTPAGGRPVQVSFTVVAS